MGTSRPVARSRSVADAAMPATSAPTAVARTSAGRVACRRARPSADSARAWARHPVRSTASSSSVAPAATSRSTARWRSRPASAAPPRRRASRRSSSSSTRDSRSDHTGWMVDQPWASWATSGSRASTPARSTPGPTTASISAWSAPPSTATVAATRWASGGSPAITSSARKSSIPAPAAAVRSSASAGHPPRSVSRSRARARSSANAASSSSAKARSASLSRSTRPWADRRASGTGGSCRPLSTTWPLAGRASTSAASSAAPPVPAPISWTSSTTRHTCRGDRRHIASASAEPRSAAAMSPGSCRRARSVSRAVASPSARRRASPSPELHPSQRSSPRGASRFSSTACASSDDLPNPAPATTTVTGRSHRPCSRRSSPLRRTSGRPAWGGE